MPENEIRYTERGFPAYEFRDSSGEACVLRMSSSTEPKIWLGAREMRLSRCVQGRGWEECPLPEGEVTGNEKMLLSRDQAAELIPLLQRFVDTGSISPPPGPPPAVGDDDGSARA